MVSSFLAAEINRTNLSFSLQFKNTTWIGVEMTFQNVKIFRNMQKEVKFVTRLS